MKEKTASASMMEKMQVTTQDVVALPTASAPPLTRMPLLIATRAMIHEKVSALTSACPMKLIVTYSCRLVKKEAGESLKKAMPTTSPAAMPETAEQTVSRGKVR